MFLMSPPRHPKGYMEKYAPIQRITPKALPLEKIIKVRTAAEMKKKEDLGYKPCLTSELDWGRGEVVICLKCQHKFKKVSPFPECQQCNECIESIFSNRHDHETVQPKGVMSAKYHDRIGMNRLRIPGYHHDGAIVVTYRFERGNQNSKHPFPDTTFSPFTLKTYLPYTIEGIAISKRLRRAFDRGLLFELEPYPYYSGGDTCRVVQKAVKSQKINLHGGQQRRGYPDPNALANISRELNEIGVKENKFAYFCKYGYKGGPVLIPPGAGSCR